MKKTTQKSIEKTNLSLSKAEILSLLESKLSIFDFSASQGDYEALKALTETLFAGSKTAILPAIIEGTSQYAYWIYGSEARLFMLASQDVRDFSDYLSNTELKQFFDKRAAKALSVFSEFERESEISSCVFSRVSMKPAMFLFGYSTPNSSNLLIFYSFSKYLHIESNVEGTIASLYSKDRVINSVTCTGLRTITRDIEFKRGLGFICPLKEPFSLKGERKFLVCNSFNIRESSNIKTFKTLLLRRAKRIF